MFTGSVLCLASLPALIILRQPAGRTTFVIPPNSESKILHLLEPLRMEGPVADGYVLSNVTIAGESILLELTGSGRTTTVELLHPDDGHHLPVVGGVAVRAAEGVPAPVVEAIQHVLAGRQASQWPWIAVRSAPGDSAGKVLLRLDTFIAMAWILFFVLLVVDATEGGVRPATLLEASALVIFALICRAALSSHGPGDLRLNLVSIFASPETIDRHWGHAPIALFRTLATLLGGITDTGIIRTNIILSSFVPLLLMGIVVTLGISRTAALIAAFLAAAHPLLIAFSGVLNRQPTYLLAAFGSVYALARFLDRGRWWSGVAFVLGTALAIHSRPEGAHVLVLDAALIAGMRTTMTRRFIGLGLVLAAGLSSMKYVGAHGMLHLDGCWNNPTWIRSTILFQDDFTPLVWIAAWLAGLVLGRRTPAAMVAVLCLVGLDLAWRATGLYGMFVGYEGQAASARYQSVLLLVLTLGLALLIDAALRWPVRARWAALAALLLGTAATYRRPYETLLKPFTVDYEYRFLREQLVRLPQDAVVYFPEPAMDDMGLVDATAVRTFVPGAAATARLSAENCASTGPLPAHAYVYLGSSCAEVVPNARLPRAEYEQWRRSCERMRKWAGAEGAVEVEVPAHKMAWYDFAGQSVRLGLYPVRASPPCAELFAGK